MIISRTYPTNEVLESSSQHWMHTLLYGELEFSELCKKWHRCVMNLTLKDQPLKPSIKDKVDLLCFNTTHYFSALHLCIFHYLGFERGKQLFIQNHFAFLSRNKVDICFEI